MSTDWRPVRHLLRCSCRHGHPGSANYAPAFLGSSGATYAAIANRRGTKIATIAIARKLLTRAYHLLARWRGAGWVLARPLRPPRRGQPRHSPRRPRLRKCMCRCTCRSLTIPPRRSTIVRNRRTRLFSRHSPALPGTPRQRRRTPLPPPVGSCGQGPTALACASTGPDPGPGALAAEDPAALWRRVVVPRRSPPMAFSNPVAIGIAGQQLAVALGLHYCVRGVTVHWGRLCGLPGRPARNRVRRDPVLRSRAPAA